MGTINNNLNSTTLIRGIYRALLNTGRTYAAFTSDHMKLIDTLKDRKEIFDPMSGYGGLMKFCSVQDYEISSYNIELNPPSYFWQVLIHPAHSSIFTELCKKVSDARRKWPKNNINIAVSDDWFPEQSLLMLENLWTLVLNFAKELSKKQAEEISLAFLLPFIGRFSSTIQGNVVTHVKSGGLCVYTGWRDDFIKYILKVQNIAKTNQDSINNKHIIRLGDAKNIKLNNKKFKAMITSPPYPNTRDYSKMFSPENYFIRHLFSKGYISNVILQGRVIGSSDVTEKEGYTKRVLNEIASPAAKDFLGFIERYKGTVRAVTDNRVYYLPYYCNYFYGLEKAYENISKYLSNDFLGYIIVVNNTARKKVIPVSDFIIETWQRLGFKTEIAHFEELSHVGGINPRVKGLSARHAEYTIRVYR